MLATEPLLCVALITAVITHGSAPHLFLELLDFAGQLLNSLAICLLFRLRISVAPPASSIGNQSGAVQMQMANVEPSRFCQGLWRVMQRVKNSLHILRLPVLAFELIAGVAAVDKVIGIIRSIL